MTKKLVVFNWKMNPQTLAEAKSLLSIFSTKYQTPNTEYIVCPPNIYLESLIRASAVAKGYGGLRFASQNTFSAIDGAYTGEISSKMLKNLGVEYVIIGHSERRAMGETDEIINKKVLTALKVGLKVILCVGEPSRPTTNNQQPTTKAKQYIKTQLQKDLKGIEKLSVVGGGSLVSNLTVAYEPIWAISSSKDSRQDTPEDATKIVNFIRNFLDTKYKILNTRILYGGSVNSKNISAFINKSEINGALVGHASIDKKEFTKILKILKINKI